MLVIGGAALLFFGPDQLPGVARKVGSAVRELQMTSQSFIREMERAADEADMAKFARNTPLDIEEIPPAEHADMTPATTDGETEIERLGGGSSGSKG
jgi:Sec-independent protein translocase protein TatA